MLFFMFAAVIAVAWGLLGKPYIAAAAILMWGTGDAAAALVGIPFGKHKIGFPPINGRKSWEGTAAMFIVSFLAGYLLLCLWGGYPFSIVPAVLLGALVGAATELFSSSEWDTVTVPTAVLTVLLLLL